MAEDTEIILKGNDINNVISVSQLEFLFYFE
jgi:hypothetical protein